MDAGSSNGTSGRELMPKEDGNIPLRAASVGT